MPIEDTLQTWLGPLSGDLPRLYLVGGAVRDHLLGRAPRDIDLMCTEPEKFARRLGGRHGAAVVAFTGKTEAPCYRVVSRSEKGSFIDVVGVLGGSVEADLARRDFTFNAMAMRVVSAGELSVPIDPFGGVADLNARRVRATGPGVFEADPLRIVRAARFAAELGCVVEPITLGLMQSAAPGLTKTAGERLQRELELLFSHPISAPHVRMLDAVGALETILPPIRTMRGCAQNGHHHLDVWSHSLAALEGLEEILHEAEKLFGVQAASVHQNLESGSRLAILKLAVLLHDAGKPETRSVDPATGRIAFLGHAPRSAALAAAAADRLKLSVRERELLETLVANHMHALDLSGPQVTEKGVLHWFRRLGADMVPLVLLSLADSAATRGAASSSSEAARERHRQWAREIIDRYFNSIRKRLSAELLINGEDLIAMGLAPGPELGRILRMVREAQDEGAVISREEALDLGRRLMEAKPEG